MKNLMKKKHMSSITDGTIDNQVAFATIFATIHKWWNDMWHLCYCNSKCTFINLLANR
jgi:hypothetical protein